MWGNGHFCIYLVQFPDHDTKTGNKSISHVLGPDNKESCHDPKDGNKHNMLTEKKPEEMRQTRQ